MGRKRHSVEDQKEKERKKKQRLRANRNYKSREQDGNTAGRRQLREMDSVRKQEQTKNTDAKRNLRKDSTYRDVERDRNAQIQRRLREDGEYRHLERGRNSELQRRLREDEQYSEKERVRNAVLQRRLRKDEEYKRKEQSRNSELKRKLRSNETYKIDEQAGNTKSHKDQRNDEECSNLIKFASWERLLEQYHSEIKDGPTHVCTSCGGLGFAKSMRNVSKKYFEGRGCSTEFIDQLAPNTTRDGEFELCGTCFIAASKKEIPKRHLCNGFGFPEIPDVLKQLTQLEERLVSPRIPFMQIRTLGVYQQKGLRGNVVNVENDLDTCAKVLPRNIKDSATVQVMLMRRMQYKAPYMYETIRPRAVYEAAQYLCQTELYKKEKIMLSDNWMRQNSAKTSKFIIDEKDEPSTDELTGSGAIPEPMQTDSADPDSDDEDEANENPGADETLILKEDNKVVKIAPGEGKRPVPWLMDFDAEVLSFPSIYGGVPRKIKDIKVSAVHIARSEARMFDRRAVKPEKILYTAKRLQNQHLADQIQICLRKKKGGRTLTAGDLKNETFIDKLVSQDDGYKCLQKIRQSPAYWQAQEKKVLAMSRQLFIPTLFFTASAAETKWGELLVILELIHNDNHISEEEALAMSFQKKVALIRVDPCVCALYFDHRFRALLNLILKKKNGALSPYELVDHYVKTEFAHRGSAHNHSLLWLKDAPIYDRENQDSVETCINYIDSLITCRRDGDEELANVIGFQVHKHTHTCKRKTASGGFKCRFNLPCPVMPRTTILQPLLEESPNYAIANKNYERIQDELNKWGRNFLEDISFDDYLLSLKMTKEDYILAVRSSIKRDKIFLKRRTCDTFINAYNEKILKAWKANIDIQYVLDPYACVKYCISYLTKSCSGVSKLMRDVEKELKLGNATLKEKMRKIANKFINSVEISAQEAAYLVLGIPLTNCSRDDIFINTGPPNERVGLLKSAKLLNQMDDTDHDIYTRGLLDHYVERPTELENICLAEFASMYKIVKAETATSMALQDGSGHVLRRGTGRIVRYRRYNEQQDIGNYCREQIMLYVPWRNEDHELINVNVLRKFEHRQESILINRKLIDPNHGKSKVEDLAEQVEQDLNDIEMTHHTDPDYDTDIAQATGDSRQVKKVDFLMPPKQIPGEEFLRITRNLNEKQRRFFLHIVHRLNTGQVPFHEYIAGGAGVGKSFLISAIVQYVLRRFVSKPGVSLESLPVLICAPTGKAAFNVGGVTVHCAFRLPPNEYNGQLAQLPEDLCNSLRVKFRNLELVLIDEISMLSLAKLHQIDSRLRQIFQCNAHFGGISVLVIGDFYQIRPVMAQFVFETPKNMPFGFVIGNELWSLFKMYELTQIMRQNKALAFAESLYTMARGTMTDEHVELIKTREVEDEDEIPADAVHLFCTNAECEAHNLAVHESLNTESAISLAVDTIQGTVSESQRQEFAEYVQTLKPSDADGLPTKLRLQIRAQYMVSTNVDVSDGIFNGSNGTLMHISYSTTADGERVPSTVYISFASPMVGVEARRRHTYPPGVDHSWTPITLLTKQLNKVGFHQGLTVTRRQLPLLPANGITIIKAQGSGYRNVAVHISKHMRRDLLYVACSRAFTLDGLYIVGEFRPPPPPPQYLLDEIASLNSDPLQLSLQFMEEVSSDINTIIYHNVQSLRAHYLDIIADVGYLAAEFMCLLEPWTFQNEDYNFPSFIDTRRQDCQGVRSSYGSFVTAKTPIRNYEFAHTKTGPSAHFSFTTWTIKDVYCCLVYRQPNSSIPEFVQALERKLIDISDKLAVIFGDFNIDIMMDSQLSVLFKTYGHHLLVPINTSSTNGGSQIDLACANFAEVHAWYTESVFSYHKPICITWPKEEELHKLDIHQLEKQLCELNIESSSTLIPEQNDVSVMDVGDFPNPVNILPPVTEVNASCRHWRVGGRNLSLNELKTLEHDISQNDIQVLKTVAARHNEVFTPMYLTDSIIDVCLMLITAGSQSLSIDAATVQLVLNGQVQLPYNSGDWDQLDNVFIPVNEGLHWMLMVVKPMDRSVLFLDPIPKRRVPKTVETTLLSEVSRIMNIGLIDIHRPSRTYQEDSYNCAVFVVKYAEQLINHNSTLFQFDPAAYRVELINRIWMNSDENLVNLNE